MQRIMFGLAVVVLVGAAVVWYVDRTALVRTNNELLKTQLRLDCRVSPGATGAPPVLNCNRILPCSFGRKL